MKKLVFVTGEDLLDVDLPIVKEIHRHYDFTWIIILRGYGWFTEDKLRALCAENGIKAIFFLQNFKLKSIKTLFFHFKILRLLRSLKADLIYDSYLGVPHMHFFTPLFLLPSKKFVIAIHDVVLHYKMNNRAIYSLYYGFLKNRYENIHLFSENQYKIFISEYPNKRILVAPLCLKDFGPPSTFLELTVPDRIKNFLFFGIIRENKGVDLLIQAANELSKKYKNFIITIAGKSDSGCWERHKDLIENETLFKLHIRIIANEEVPNLLSTADFMILPYRDVTQSGVLLSAYNYNLPVIASNLSGFNEYVEEGVTGFLFENENVKELEKSMEKALLLTTPEYSRMREKVAKFVKEEISVPAIGSKYVKYFDSIC